VLTPDDAPARPACVVVPFWNEAAGMGATLAALAAQTDGAFTLVLVDNASTDGSGDVARAFAAPGGRGAGMDVRLVREPQKGTGAAADTGVRYAVARGARWVARTDADCLPAPDWLARLRAAVEGEGMEFVAGRIKPRTDEGPMPWRARALLAAMIWAAERYGRLHRRGPQFRYPYFMAAGNNLAIAAGLYVRAGGFPRTAIEDAHEDRALSERVRTLTARARVVREAVVYNSARRVRAYGHLNTLRWYRNHGYRPAVVDVR
jgi:glycosyltransferase involved in cell wall biosynthesis